MIHHHRLESIPDETNRLGSLAIQVASIGAAVLLYFGVRGRTQGSAAEAVTHGRELLRLESTIGLDVEARLQGLILDSQWAVTLMNWIYIWGHWPVIVVTLVWLYRTRRFEYLVLRNALFVSGAIGLIIFMIHPVAPPRLLPSGFVDTVTELSNSYRVLQPPSLVNKYAALPSLHVGWNLLIGIAIYRTGAGPAARVFGVVSPILMFAAVVLTGNHYLVDGLLGAAVALIGLAVARWLTPKLAFGPGFNARSARRSPSDQETGLPGSTPQTRSGGSSSVARASVSAARRSTSPRSSARERKQSEVREALAPTVREWR